MLRSFRFGSSLVPALIASISVHAVIVAILTSLGPAASLSANEASAPLLVQLAKAMDAAPDPSSAAALPTLSAVLTAALGVGPAPTSALDAGRPQSPETPPASPTAKTEPSAQSVAGSAPFEGHIDVAPDSILARLGENLSSRALWGFPVEVERPVGIGGALKIAYPPSALRSREEGQVLAWIVVNEIGTPEEIHIVEGGGELAAAVVEAIATTRFEPAVNDGAPIRFHATLQFDFRIVPSPPRNVAVDAEQPISR